MVKKMNEILKIITTACAVFFAAGFGYAGSKYLSKQASVQKNEHMKSLLTISSQVVLSAQELLAPGKVQQASAAEDAKARLDENDLGKYFTQAQILSYIKQAYAVNKANGTLDAVKPVVSDEDLAAAEAVVTPKDNTAVSPTAEETTAEQ